MRHTVSIISLAPLLIHAIVSGNSFYLKKWSRGMPPAQEKNSYLNFLSTHDGIGMRPIEGILPQNEIVKYLSFLKNRVDFFHIDLTKEKSLYMR